RYPFESSAYPRNMHLKLFASSLVRLDLSTCAYPTDPN
ncbi:hypothetical protein PHMEG_00038583, partial [Phytophthora megakarya]